MVEQYVEVFEGDLVQMCVDQLVEICQIWWIGIVDVDMVQVGMGLFGCQWGYGGFWKMVSLILDVFLGNIGSVVRYIGLGFV